VLFYLILAKIDLWFLISALQNRVFLFQMTICDSNAPLLFFLLLSSIYLRPLSQGFRTIEIHDSCIFKRDSRNGSRTFKNKHVSVSFFGWTNRGNQGQQKVVKHHHQLGLANCIPSPSLSQYEYIWSQCLD